MENRDMIRMANQIAAYFEAYPRADALDGIAKHIKNFWDPRMRKQLDEYIASGAEGLSPLVVAAFGPKKAPATAAKAKAK
jgi:formate dehydrogenase subunit delta